MQGFSYVPKEKIYMKHLDDIDHSTISKIQTDFTSEFLNMGVPTRKDRVDFLMETEEWTQDDEDEITSAEFFITDNIENYNLSQIQSQKERIGKALDEARNTVAKKKGEKEQKIGAVAETRAEKLANSYYIYFSFYKDKELTERCWNSFEEFDEQEDHELTGRIYLYNETLAPFKEKNFKKIAVMPFTLNIASYCKDQGMFFFGKAITEFTNYQLAVFTKVMRNTFVLRESKQTTPEINNDLMMNTLVDWYDIQYDIIIAESKSR